jgi:hypothetical protein
MNIEAAVAFIRKNINNIPVEDRRNVVMGSLVNRGCSHHIKKCPEGIVVDPAKLPLEDLNAMYDLVKFHVDKSH